MREKKDKRIIYEFYYENQCQSSIQIYRYEYRRRRMSMSKFPIKLSISIFVVVASSAETETSLAIIDVGVTGLEVVDVEMVDVFVIWIVDVVEVLGEPEGIGARIGTVPEESGGVYS